MENIIENKLKSVEGYLMSIKRNSKNGWYEIEIGLPFNWLIKGTKNINCDIITSDKNYKIIKISPVENSEVSVDILIDFATVVIETNKKVADKENQLKKLLEAEKVSLENKIRLYYDELEQIKEESFNEYDKRTSEPEKKSELELQTKRQYTKKIKLEQTKLEQTNE